MIHKTIQIAIALLISFSFLCDASQTNDVASVSIELSNVIDEMIEINVVMSRGVGAGVCSAGMDGFAQELANYLKVIVRAPTSDIWTDEKSESYF